MPDAPTPRPLIEYFAPGPADPPAERLYRLARAGTLVAAGVAMLIVLGAILTRSGWFALFGAAWLLAGAALTAGAFWAGATYAIGARAARYPAPHSRARARRAVLMPLLNLPLAAVCMVAGATMIEPARADLNLRITNPTAAAADLTLRLPEGAILGLGTLPAGHSLSRTLAVPSRGEAWLDVAQGGRVWRQFVERWDGDDLDRGRLDASVALDPTTAR